MTAEKNYSVNVLSRMRRVLPFEVFRAVKRLARFAEDNRCKAYMVGGFVRDLLLGVKNLDMDIVIEGDAIKFAGYIAGRMNMALIAYKKFGTAVLTAKKPLKGVKFKIDIAAARTETYERPGALPFVRFGSIGDDLHRRDFTINAMAVSIGRKNFGELIDPFGGRRDLKRKKIRVMHERSFVDDPTRIFRAVRFEQRYDFKIDRHTAGLIKGAVKAEMFDKVSGERLREEIVLLLKDKEPLKAIKRMRGLHELRFISAKIKFQGKEEKICGRVEEFYGRYKRYFLKRRPLDLWLVYFMAIIDRLGIKETLKVCARFAMRRNERTAIISCKKFRKSAAALLSAEKNVPPSEIYRLLLPLSGEALIFLTAKCGGALAERRSADFLRKHNGACLRINGADLKKLGIKPGPEFARILKKTLYAKIDGKLRTRKDELFFAKREVL